MCAISFLRLLSTWHTREPVKCDRRLCTQVRNLQQMFWIYMHRLCCRNFLSTFLTHLNWIWCDQALFFKQLQKETEWKYIMNKKCKSQTKRFSWKILSIKMLRIILLGYCGLLLCFFLNRGVMNRLTDETLCLKGRSVEFVHWNNAFASIEIKLTVRWLVISTSLIRTDSDRDAVQCQKKMFGVISLV